MDIFRMDKDTELSGEVLSSFIIQHQVQKQRFQELKDQYMSKPPILKRPDKEEKWKPDNKLVCNFAKYITDTFNGFFNGIPLKVSHRDDEKINESIQEFWKRNSMDNVMNELAKDTSIFGRSYLFLYQNENSLTEVAYNDPLDMFIIYSDEIRPRALYGVRYAMDDVQSFSGQLFDTTDAYRFNLTGKSLTREEDYQLFYGRIPIIEFIENEERQSLFEPVESLINAYNETISAKMDDVDYFADAYLAILGALLDEDSLKQLKDNRIINLAGADAEKIIVKFLEKPDADQTQENLLDRNERHIYEIAQVANISDTKFGSYEASGIALKYKLQPMGNLARKKELKFQQGVQTLFRMLFNVIPSIPAGKKDEYVNIQYEWTRNMPSNDKDESETVRNLTGIISHKKQLDMLSAVSDTQAELDEIEKETRSYAMSDTELAFYESLEAGDDD